MANKKSTFRNHRPLSKEKAAEAQRRYRARKRAGLVGTPIVKPFGAPRLAAIRGGLLQDDNERPAKIMTGAYNFGEHAALRAAAPLPKQEDVAAPVGTNPIDDDVQQFYAAPPEPKNEQVAVENAEAHLPSLKEQLEKCLRDCTTVAGLLQLVAELHIQRNKEYGDAYKHVGAALRALMGEPVTLETDAQFGRFMTLATILGKLQRYARNFNNGGHADSLFDIMAYAGMLRMLDKGAD